MAYQSRLEIVVDGSTAERGLRRVEGGLGRVDRAGDRAAGSIDNVNNELGRVKGVALAASGALLGVAAAFGTQDIIRYADAWTNATNQLKQATSSSAELAIMQDKLVELSKDTRSNFNSTATLYSRLARSTTELALTQSDLLDIVTTINQSFALSGASAAEASGAIFQLTQGLAAGALRGEEFNSVAEQAPILMLAIAEETGMALGALREFAATGGITAEIVVRALKGAADTIGKEFNESLVSFSQNMEIANTNIVQFVGTSERVSGAVDALGGGIVELTEHIDEIVTVATLAAGVFGARMAGALATSASGMLAAQIQAARYQAALASMAGVSRVAAASQIALGTAARGAAGAMALLGGPVGIALIAAGSLYYFREELGLVGEQASNTQRRIDALTGSMGAMGETAIRSSIESVRAEMQFLEDQAWNTQRAIANLGPGETFGGRTKEELQAQLEFIGRDFSSAKETLGQLEQRLESFEATTSNVVGTTALAAGEVDKLAKSYQSLYDRLRPVEALQREYAQSRSLINQFAPEAEQAALLDDLARSWRNAENAAEVYGFTGEASMEKVSDAARDLGFTFESAFENAIIEGEGFRSVLQGIAKDIARIALRKSVSEPFVKWLGTAVSAFSGSFGGGSYGGSGWASSATFAGGGYTGDGATMQPAGIVHAGEFVVRKSVVDNPGVLPMLTRLNKGYATGGYVGGSTSVSNSPSIVVNAPVTVTAQPGVSDQDAARQGKAISNQIDARIMQTLTREKRPGGLLYQR